jgi:stringent starvation protein A
MSTIRRAVMTLYSSPRSELSHRVRIVLAEKAINVNIVSIDPEDLPEELLEMNPYGTLPTLVDRSVVLYQAGIVMEYLDERFPHPPLLPVYPIARAKSRLTMYRIERDWCQLAETILAGGKGAAEARTGLQDGLISLAPVFSEMPFFLSEEFSLVDCMLAPLLWRLSEMEIVLPKKAKPIEDYMERIFARDSFQASLSEFEQELRLLDDI